MSSPLVLVTGVSGFLGAHVVNELLKEGYRVRGTVRSSKIDFVRESFASFPDVEVAGIDDIAAGDFSEVLKGVTAVVHVAAYLPGRANAEESLNSAIEGTLNIARQAEKAGIKNIVAVSSSYTNSPTADWGTARTITADDWNTSVTKEDALKPSATPFDVYTAEKVLAERALWDWAEKHPHVEVATVNPAYFAGPLAPGWRAPTPSMSALSTNFYIYNLLQPTAPLIPTALLIDVRDVARACVLALRAPPTASVGRKRFLMAGPWLDYRAAAAYIKTMRPSLAGRLSTNVDAAPEPGRFNLDVNRAKEVLGLTYTPWQDTVLSGVDSLLAIEKEWVAKGWEPEKEIYGL